MRQVLIEGDQDRLGVMKHLELHNHNLPHG